MYTNCDMKLSGGVIAIIVIFSTIAFIGLVVLLYFTIIRNKTLAKSVRDLDSKYEYLHSLIFGQDQQYLKRIEYISTINLLYVEIYQKQLAVFNYLKDDKDVYASKKLDDFKDLLANKKFMQVREEMPDFKHFMNDFEVEVNKLNNDLLQIIRPEEECNHMAYDAKEQFRLIKQEYTAHQNDLVMLKNSYEAVFEHVEELFTKYEQFINEASYDDCIQLMPKIKKVLVELNNINKAMPELCTLSTKVMPSKITELKGEYRRMQQEGYPTHHLVSNDLIDKMEEKVMNIAHELKLFKYKNSLNELNEISSKIDNIFIGFKKEADDRKTFESEINDVLSHVGEITNNFIKLCNTIPSIQKYYVITEDRKNIRKKIQLDINKMGRSKRDLDDSYHSSQMEPYSILLNKTLELKTEANDIDNQISEFRTYLSSLKEDAEKAHDLVSSFYYKLKKAERQIDDVAMNNFKAKYKDKIEEIYNQLEIINTTCNIKPIDINKINAAVSYINFDAESTLNQIEQEYNMMNLAESSIVYINKARLTSSEANAILQQNEKMFYDGEFEKAYNSTNELIQRIKEEEKRK